VSVEWSKAVSVDWAAYKSRLLSIPTDTNAAVRRSRIGLCRDWVSRQCWNVRSAARPMIPYLACYWYFWLLPYCPRPGYESYAKPNDQRAVFKDQITWKCFWGAYKRYGSAHISEITQIRKTRCFGYILKTIAYIATGLAMLYYVSWALLNVCEFHCLDEYEIHTPNRPIFYLFILFDDQNQFCSRVCTGHSFRDIEMTFSPAQTYWRDLGYFMINSRLAPGGFPGVENFHERILAALGGFHPEAFLR
jgi:hypothetical protein